MSGEARIIVTLICTWDGDGTSSHPADVKAYNDAMAEVFDYANDLDVDGVTLVRVEATG